MNSTLSRTGLFASLALVLAACTVETTDSAPCPPSGPGASSGGSGTGATPQGGCVRDRDVTASETWSPAACPDGYLVKKAIAITGAGVELKIEPGTVVKFENEAGLQVGGSTSLIAEGTADQKIRFTGWQAAPGSWRGIVFASNSAKNRIANAVVEHAGSDRDVDGAIHVGLSYEQPARVELADVEMKDNARYGLYVRQDAKLGRFERVSIRNNALGAAHVVTPSVAQLRGTGNVFENNGPDNLVLLETNILVELLEDATWPSVAPAKYRVVGQHGEGGDLVRVKKHLVIEPGAVFEMAGGSGFLVAGGTAGLKAAGTPDQKIVFRGIADSSWLGITYGESTWSENRLENVEVHNATSAPEWSYFATGSSDYRKAGIMLGYNFVTAVPLTLKDVVVAGPNNAPADVFRKNSANLVLEGTNTGTGAGGALEIETTPY